MAHNNPKISVVTVCYNAIECIEDTILSVIEQTYENIEYIVIDGASIDGTVEVINRYRDKISYFVSEPDKGIYDAMNKGIKVASGDWINFMNAGDFFYQSDVLERVASEVNNNYGVVFGDLAIVKNGILYRESARPFYKKDKLQHYMGFNHQCTFVRLDLAKESPFDLRFKLAADYNMIIGIYKKGEQFKQLYIIIAQYLDSGLSEQKRRQHTFETLMVDNPNNRCLNIIKSYIIAFVKKSKKQIISIIGIFFPNFVKMLREKKGVVARIK